MHKNSNSGKTLKHLKPKHREDEWLLSLSQKAAKSSSAVHFSDLHMENSDESDPEEGEVGDWGAEGDGDYGEDYDEDYDKDESYMD